MSSLHKISVSLFIFFSTLAACGSDLYRQSAGAGESGMGFVCVMKRSFWSSFHNQACLAGNDQYSFGLNYENRFSVKELGNRTAGIVIPAGKTSFGAVYSFFGYPDFKREMAGLACGLKLSEKLAAGVQIDYFSEKTCEEYSDSKTITFETGILLTPNENMRVGIHIFNPLPKSLSISYIPSILRIGAGTSLSTSLFAGLEAEMSTGSKLIIRTGLEYETMRKVWLRGGFSTDNNSFSFGLGYHMNFVLIDLGFVTHDKLGITSSASLIFKIR